MAAHHGRLGIQAGDLVQAVTEPVIEHVYGGDVGDNPVQGVGVTVQAGLATADATPDDAEVTDGVD